MPWTLAMPMRLSSARPTSSIATTKRTSRGVRTQLATYTSTSSICATSTISNRLYCRFSATSADSAVNST
jgi:hypothetical protein